MKVQFTNYKGPPPPEHINAENRMVSPKKPIMNSEKKESTSQLTTRPTKPKVSINPLKSQRQINTTKRVEIHKPYDRPIDGAGGSLLGSKTHIRVAKTTRESPEKIQEREKDKSNMTASKKIEIPLEEYQTLIGQSRKQQEMIDKLMETIKDLSEKIKDFESDKKSQRWKRKKPTKREGGKRRPEENKQPYNENERP